MRKRGKRAEADALYQAFLADPTAVSLADYPLPSKRKGTKSKRGGKSRGRQPTTWNDSGGIENAERRTGAGTSS